MNLSDKLKELRKRAEKVINFTNEPFDKGVLYQFEFNLCANPETIIKMCECIEEMKEILESHRKQVCYCDKEETCRYHRFLEKWFIDNKE